VSIGTQAPLTGTALPAGAANIRQGVEYPTLHQRNSGAQDGFFDCMDGYGYEVTLIERGRQGMSASDQRGVQLPAAIADAAALGLTVDLLVVISGGNDAKTALDEAQYPRLMFGPFRSEGKGSPDTSLFGQARTAWGDALPIVLPTLTQHNGQDLMIGQSASNQWYLHEDVRADQLSGCADDASCWPVLTGLLEVPLHPNDDHPTSEGYYNLGRMICERAVGSALVAGP
jgi:hypothetical protein